MNWLKRILIGIGTTGVLLGAPLVPHTDKAMVWRVMENGTCEAEYTDGSIRALSCDEYWKIARTPNYPTPSRTVFRSMLSGNDANAAIAFDTTSRASTGDACGAGASSISWSHTVTGSNPVLVVGYSMFDTNDADRTVTTHTYNSIAITDIREDDNDADNASTALTYLIAPDTGGSFTISATFNGAVGDCVGYAVSLTGVDQTSPLDAQNGTIATNADSISTAVTTVADNSWVVDQSIMTAQSTFNLTVGGGQTQRQNQVVGNEEGGMSTVDGKTPAGGEAMNWTDGGIAGTSADWAISAASFKPAAAGTAVTNVGELILSGD